MRGDSPSAAELLSAMERISTQVQHIRGQGRDAFLDGDGESGVLQAATCHLIIRSKPSSMIYHQGGRTRTRIFRSRPSEGCVID